MEITLWIISLVLLCILIQMTIHRELKSHRWYRILEIILYVNGFVILVVAGIVKFL